MELYIQVKVPPLEKEERDRNGNSYAITLGTITHENRFTHQFAGRSGDVGG
jgi:hypothetical protein